MRLRQGSLISCVISPTTAIFSLSSPSPSFHYAASNLVETTSSSCRDYYSKPIACSSVLLRLVGGQQLNYKPSQDDLDAVCTHDCKNALQEYVSNLGDACNKVGDRVVETLDEQLRGSGQRKNKHTDGDAARGTRMAKRDAGPENSQKGNKKKTSQGLGRLPANSTDDHVWVVGNILEYAYSQACMQDENKQYCFLSPQPKSSTSSASSTPTPSATSVASPADPFNNYLPPPTCSSLCSVTFYRNVKKFGGASRRHFVSDLLIRRPPDVMQDFTNGWNEVQDCQNNAAGGDPAHDISGPQNAKSKNSQSQEGGAHRSGKHDGGGAGSIGGTSRVGNKVAAVTGGQGLEVTSATPTVSSNLHASGNATPSLTTTVTSNQGFRVRVRMGHLWKWMSVLGLVGLGFGLL